MDLDESYAKPEFMRRSLFVAFLYLSSLTISGALPNVAMAQEVFLPEPGSDAPMSEAEVRESFSGQTHRGSYNFQIKDFKGVHFEEWTSDSGKVLHRMGDRLDKGVWTQKGEQICYDYESEDLLPACFSFYRRGNCIYHYQETVNGNYSPGFTAVSVIKGEEPSCEPPMS
jgi:hypothetical protein